MWGTVVGMNRLIESVKTDLSLTLIESCTVYLPLCMQLWMFLVRVYACGHSFLLSNNLLQQRCALLGTGCLLQALMLKFYVPVPLNAIVFRDKFFKEDIKLREGLYFGL